MATPAETQRAEEEKKRRLEKAQYDADVITLMRMPQFRRLVRKFLPESRRSPLSSDVNLTYSRLGRKDFINEFLDSLRSADIDSFHVIEREFLKETTHG